MRCISLQRLLLATCLVRRSGTWCLLWLRPGNKGWKSNLMFIHTTRASWLFCEWCVVVIRCVTRDETSDRCLFPTISFGSFFSFGASLAHHFFASLCTGTHLLLFFQCFVLALPERNYYLHLLIEGRPYRLSL